MDMLLIAVLYAVVIWLDYRPAKKKRTAKANCLYLILLLVSGGILLGGIFFPEFPKTTTLIEALFPQIA